MDSILSVRINEDLKEKFLKLAEEQGVNNKEFMDVIIKAYEVNKASSDVDYIKNDVDELQVIIKRVLDIYINIIEKNKIKSKSLTNDFKTSLCDEYTKSNTLKEEVINLRKEGDTLNVENKKLKEKVDEYKELLIKTKDDLKEYKELNIMLKEKVKELIEYKSISEKLKIVNSDIKEELILSIRKSDEYLNQIGREHEDKISVERQLSEMNSLYEDKLKEQELEFNKRLLLLKDELNLIHQKKMLDKEETYREEIWNLKSKFDDKITMLIADKETLLLKISNKNYNDSDTDNI